MSTTGRGMPTGPRFCIQRRIPQREEPLDPERRASSTDTEATTIKGSIGSPAVREATEKASLPLSPSSKEEVFVPSDATGDKETMQVIILRWWMDDFIYPGPSPKRLQATTTSTIFFYLITMKYCFMMNLESYQSLGLHCLYALTWVLMKSATSSCRRLFSAKRRIMLPVISLNCFRIANKESS